jgi:uncharacterized membrane protein YdbT with pleckstrin-like domain
LSSKRAAQGEVVWFGKPYIVPALIIRTVTVIVFAALFLWLEFASGGASLLIAGYAVFVWTMLIFSLIWIFSALQLLILWATNRYVLRQDGLEVRRGILRLHSFVVTPSGFGDLSVYQSIGGRIFKYGTLTVNSQGERETKLFLVKAPFTVADQMRDIMGKPVVRVEGHV